MPAAGRALLVPLLLRVAQGLGDDVLLLQQRPDGPWSRPLEPQIPSQGFVAIATSDQPEQPAVAVSSLASASAEKPKSGPVQVKASPEVGPSSNEEAINLAVGPIMRLAGEGQCQDVSGTLLTPYETIPGVDYQTCAKRCSDEDNCKSCDFLKALPTTRVLSTCRKFSTMADKSNTVADMYCFKKPPTATATGDPHLTNMRGEKFDVRRPGNHTFLVVPHGASKEDANLYVWARVTPLDGVLCKNRGSLYITELTLTGGWLKSIGSLRLSTGTSDFNSPASWGLSIGGSGNLSLQEFTRRLPPRMASVNVTNPERPHPNPDKHVDTLLLQLDLGATNVTMGWAHTERPKSNWLWFSIGDLGSGKLGGLLGDDDHSWVTIKPVECQEP